MTPKPVHVHPGATPRAALPTAARRRAMLALLRSELRLYLREPIGVFWSLAFPLVLLTILGVASHGAKPDADLGGLRIVDVYVPIVIAMSMAMVGVNALPPSLAAYRERGILKRLRTTPVGAARLLAAQLAVYGGAAVVAAVLELLLGRIAFGVALPGNAIGFGVAFVLAGASLLAIGLLISAVAPSVKTANALGAMSFFPLMFFAGLWLPRQYMPDALRTVSDATPLGAAVDAMQSAAAGRFPEAASLLVMAAWAAICGLGAGRLFRWE